MTNSETKTEIALPFTGTVSREAMLSTLRDYRHDEKLDSAAYWSADSGRAMEVAIKRLAPEASPCEGGGPQL